VQAVEGHVVEHGHVAVLEPGRGLGQQVRAWVIDSWPAGHHDLALAGRISWSARAIAFSPDRQTLLIGQRRHVHADAGGDRGLPGRDLAGARGEHLAHDHVVDLVGGHAGPLQRALDREAAQLGAGEVLELAEQPTHRRAGSCDDDGSGHGFLLRLRWPGWTDDTCRYRPIVPSGDPALGVMRRTNARQRPGLHSAHG
jgi:hypothetical protein